MSVVTRTESIPIPTIKHRHVLWAIDNGSIEGENSKRPSRARRSSEGQFSDGRGPFASGSDSGPYHEEARNSETRALSMLDPTCAQSEDLTSLIAANLQRLIDAEVGHPLGSTVD